MKRIFILSMILMLAAGIASVSAEKCRIKINTNPQGAMFTVNLAVLKFGPTPMSMDFDRGKTYRLTFSKDGYETVVLNYKADCKDINVTLKKERGGVVDTSGRKTDKHDKERHKRDTANVRVTANVNAAKVYVDNDYKGNTPITLKLEYGTYRFRIEKPGYDTFVERENIDRTAVEINAELDRDREAKLLIQSNIRGADVYINDQLKGKTPLNIRLDYGTYDVLVTLDGYEDYFETVDMKSRDMKIDAVLERAVRVNLHVTSNIAGADVFLNNRKVGKTPLSIQKSSGKYMLRVSLRDKGFDDYTTTIRLQKQDVDVEAILESDDLITIELPIRSRVKVDGFWYDINWDQPERKRAATTIVKIYAPSRKTGPMHDLYIEFAGLTLSKQVRFYNRKGQTPVLKLGLSLE
jgi:hypothetical protein